ncbi:DUF2834 domain-containing protein [Nonomuraea sp. NPDC050153]|uniref:DUF2834 domain-containing protein n=1 Tax=Nonomuraea sp. NPDC050153 TaxID=3364359 RepID=UPI0037B04E62
MWFVVASNPAIFRRPATGPLISALERVSSAGQDYTIGNLIRLPLMTIIDGRRRGVVRPWLFFVSSLFTSFAFAWAVYLATIERQRPLTGSQGEGRCRTSHRCCLFREPRRYRLAHGITVRCGCPGAVGARAATAERRARLDRRTRTSGHRGPRRS